VGGINGSGKSTFAATAARSETLLEQVPINPDSLTLEAEREAQRKGFDLGQSGANLVAVERAEKAVWRAIAKAESAAVETVLSSDKYVQVVEAARARGFRTRLVFVGVPTVEVAIGRVRARVAAGGHGVSDDQIRSRWPRTHDNLTVFVRIVDDVIVFSNDSEPTLVAERVGRSQNVRVLDLETLPAVSAALGL
jgi:predicted ABC-type ATPase